MHVPYSRTYCLLNPMWHSWTIHNTVNRLDLWPLAMTPNHSAGAKNYIWVVTTRWVTVLSNTAISCHLRACHAHLELHLHNFKMWLLSRLRQAYKQGFVDLWHIEQIKVNRNWSIYCKTIPISLCLSFGNQNKQTSKTPDNILTHAPF